MKFLERVFSFANDDDGLSLKDIVTLVVLIIWSSVIIIGLVNDYSGVRLEQFNMVLESATDLTVYVIVATLGLVATDSIASIISSSRRSKAGEKLVTHKKDDDIITEDEVITQVKTEDNKKSEVNSTDII